MNKQSSSQSPNGLRVRFAITFVVIAGLLFSVYTFPYAENGIREGWFAAYLRGYARLSGHVLALFDPSVTVLGQDIVGRYNLSIVKNCDAMEANILFVSAVLAFPSSVRARLVGVGVGLPVLVTLNVLRICTLYFVGLLLPGAFEFFHLELWPLLIVAAGVAAFLLWATWALRAGPREPNHVAS